MREALFIKKNRDRWLKNQHMPAEDADEMAQEFTQLVDDLAYAKTFYPSSKVTRYINSEASRIYLSIYKNRKEESSRLVTFWKYDLPLTIRKHHKVVLFSFVLFLIFFSIGFFVSREDEGVARSFFGDSYVDETLENIEKGNPFGIYESGNPILSWLHLMIHNIRVSLLMFASGIFAGIPTLNFLAQNAAMVGIFDQFFAAKGLGIQFFLVVFVHGTLELTAIIISGAAGLILGKSFLFPGTIKRLDAFKRGAKDGVKIMIGLMPVFGLAAFFEGTITRLYNDISVLTTIVTALSVVFVIWYFVVYPIQLGRKMAAQLNEEEV
ncbi:stage II sporulation protein M [Terrimonas pollutisoli]|uniref:stage II sporulation protein M n=1 Tax=Terrimonas pollutisoli TaxID=3034147 RepID=UPI0023EB6DF2|nr:stage II sporulation protein M [Terrimonas sp. H1YJ31]